MDFILVPDSPWGELSMTFDIVMGVTTEDAANGALIGGIGKPT